VVDYPIALLLIVLAVVSFVWFIARSKKQKS
jgi:hypothetical protein